jgi:hypothetical protein
MRLFGHTCRFGEPKALTELGTLIDDVNPACLKDSSLLSADQRAGMFSADGTVFDVINRRFQTSIKTPALFYISYCERKPCTKFFIYKRKSRKGGGFELVPADARTPKSRRSRRTR